MAGNDIYNDRMGLTSTPTMVTNIQARNFMKMVSKYPTHLTKEWAVRDIKTGVRVHYKV